MRIRTCAFAALVVGALVVSSALPAGATGTPDQSQTHTDTSVNVCGSQRWLQTFTAGITGGLDQVDLQIKREDAPGPLHVAIVTTAIGAPTSTILAEVTVPTANVSGTRQFQSFAFATPASVTSGTKYAILAETTGSCTDGLYDWDGDTSDPYAGGSTFYSGTEFIGFDQTFITYVTPPAQNITFGPLYDRPITKGAFTVSATAPGGTVTFTSSTPSVCSSTGTNGTTITPLAVGTCTVKADQAGSTSYAPATKSRSFQVTKASQNIAFGILGDRRLSKSPFTVSATSSSGLTVTFSTTTPSVCTSGGTNGATIALLTTGTCTVQADQAGNDTYNPAVPRTRSFTVTP